MRHPAPALVVAALVAALVALVGAGPPAPRLTRVVAEVATEPPAERPAERPAEHLADHQADHQAGEDLAAERHRMVEEIRKLGVRERPVLAAMERVPRHRFVPSDLVPRAYDDRPLPIGHGQTISQPYIVALMTELLDLHGGEKVLEIGTGSGYQAAVLSQIAGHVYTMEILPELGEKARRTLAELGFRNVEVRVGDGWKGWPEEAPFDGIVVTAAPADLPQALVDQLKIGGHLVIPVGREIQNLMVYTRTAHDLEKRTVIPVRFVPMTGEAAKEGG